MLANLTGLPVLQVLCQVVVAKTLDLNSFFEVGKRAAQLLNKADKRW